MMIGTTRARTSLSASHGLSSSVSSAPSAVACSSVNHDRGMGGPSIRPCSSESPSSSSSRKGGMMMGGRGAAVIARAAVPPPPPPPPSPRRMSAASSMHMAVEVIKASAVIAVAESILMASSASASASASSFLQAAATTTTSLDSAASAAGSAVAAAAASTASSSSLPFSFPPPLAFLFPSPNETVTIIEEADEEAASVFHAVFDWIADVSPDAIRPFVEVLGTDVADVIVFSPTLAGVARLAVLYYLFLTRPGPITGFLDFYVSGRLLGQLRSKYKSRDFALRDKLGGGNFGMAYEGVVVKEGETVGGKRELNPEQKKRRVVLKRVNTGGEIRSNFLKAGTMASGSSESGKVESYMCDKISRSPLVARRCAEYLGTFTSDESVGAFVKGTQWLVWRFESDSTLGDALDGALGSAFPYCIEKFVVGTVNENTPADKRETAVIKGVLRQILQGLSGLHSLGIIHRDIKPENLLITVDGQVKIIDFGAACDLSTSVNFNPLYGMLDPRYSPPEELVMPKTFPRAPSPVVAALLAPMAWLYGAPDRFDSFSAGMLLIQMSIPSLRAATAFRSFNTELGQCNHDLQRWRELRGKRYDFTLLDRNNKAGWDLATKLVCPRGSLNRGRISVEQALAHRYFLPEF